MKTFNHVYETPESFGDFATANALENHEQVLVQIFSGVLDPEVLRGVIETVKTRLPHAKIVGATTDGEIMDGKVFTHSIAISCTVFEKTTLRSAARKHGIHDSFHTGAAIMKSLMTPETKLVILFGDGLHTNGEELLRGVQSVNKDVVISGWLAGDNTTFEHTYVFTESDFLENGVVGVAFDNPDLTIMNDYTFDWLNIGKKLTITKVVKNRVYTIDGMSAVDVYAKYLGKEIAERLPAIGIEFPLILDRRGTKIARAVLQTHEDGSLSFAGNMNEGERVQFGLGNAELILRSSSKLGEKFRDKSVESIFVYSCMARRRFMAESIPLEIAPLQAVANTAGFFTYGEFFHIDACNELLNETMTVAALSENAGKAQRSKPAKKESKQEDDYFYTIKALSHLVDATSTELETLNSNLEKEVRKKAEEIQTSQQAYLEGYKHIIDHVPIAIWMGDSDNKAIYANALFCGLSGYRLEEIIGKVSHNFWTLKSIACTYPKHMGVRYEEENLIHEGEFLSQDGRIIPMRLTVIPVANGGSVWMMVDMREYRALEDQKKHLEDINKIKDDFINIASHELRTPLTSIKGYLSMMLDEDFGELPDDIRRVSGIMLESSNRLISMIGDMLDSAKLESGNMFFRHDTFSVASVLTSVYDEFKSVSAQSWLRLKCDIQSDANVTTDSGKFRQVIVNLVGNAMKFTPQDGSITIRAKLAKTGKKIKIEVVDTGIGVNKNDQRQIFSKFVQIDNTLNRTYQGSGLGLAISKEIVSHMGWDLQLKSEVGKGSNFHFSLPVTQNP